MRQNCPRRRRWEFDPIVLPRYCEPNMIDAVVKVLDRFIELLQYKERKRQELFNTLLQPLFEDLTVMHTDYIKMFEECRAELLDRTYPLKDVAEALRQRRIEYEGMRDKSNAFIDALKEKPFAPEVQEFLRAAAYQIPHGELGPARSTPSSMILRALYTKQELSGMPGTTDIDVHDELLELVNDTVNSLREQ